MDGAVAAGSYEVEVVVNGVVFYLTLSLCLWKSINVGTVLYPLPKLCTMFLLYVEFSYNCVR